MLKEHSPLVLDARIWVVAKAPLGTPGGGQAEDRTYLVACPTG